MANATAVIRRWTSHRAGPGAAVALGAALFTVFAVALAGPAGAQPCPDPTGARCASVAQPDTFPRIHFRALPGVIGSAGQDSTVSRKVSLVWDRDTVAEKRAMANPAGGGFGGYNIYRVYTNRDTCQLELIRRFVYADTLLWHFPQYVHRPQYAGTDSEFVLPSHEVRLTFVDPDSAGNLVKRCRRYDLNGNCASRGDSVFALVPPPPPPDGYPAYYAIVYAADPLYVQSGFEELFVPDTTQCLVAGDRTTCCNINNHDLNLMREPVIVTGAPTADLEEVFVVPNPYRGSEPWDPTGTNRVQFRNLPEKAEIRIYTVAGDLVRILDHESVISGAADWDLKNGDGRDVTAGIYMYRVTTPQGFEIRKHLVVVR
jgi:hypothetical protein